MNLLPTIIRVIPAIAASEITFSALKRRSEIPEQKLSSELGSAALYAISAFTPLPGVAAVATTIFIGYSLYHGSDKDAYLSSQFIRHPFRSTWKIVGDHLLVPVVKLVWKVVKAIFNGVKTVFNKIHELTGPLFRNIYENILKPIGKFVKDVAVAVWTFARDLAVGVFTPVVNLVINIANSVLKFLGKVFHGISERFFKNPRWAAVVLLIAASAAYSHYMK